MVKIQRPDKLNGQDYPPSVTLYAVEALEVNPPAGQEPIHWRLLTTHQVVCLEQALQIIRWYTWRWRIEQLFATLKTAGLNVEATQLESVAAIQRLTVLALSLAVRILQLLPLPRVVLRKSYDTKYYDNYYCLFNLSLNQI